MHHILKDFLLAIQGNTKPFSSFLKKWSALDDTLRTNHDSLPKDTVSAIHSSVSVIGIVSSDIIHLEKQTQQMDEAIAKDLSKLFDEKMTVDELQSPMRSTGNVAPSTPLYIKPAYTWLLSNLHNPYPSKEVKKNISLDTQCSVKDIDAWFIDVRKRIGWNSLRKTHFDNKQEKIIAAAARVYNPKATSYTDDLTTPLYSEMDPNDNHRAAFLTIKRNARALYADKFPDLITQFFDHTAYQVSPTVRPKIDDIKAGLNSGSTFTSTDDTHTNNSYPTPEPSPRCHVEEPQTSVPQQVPQHLQSNVRKRRELSQEREGDGEHSESNSSRPSKRIRYDDSHANSLPEANKPTLLQNAIEITKITSTTDTIPTAQKRKRRLSDADCHPPSKRPHNALCMPHFQTVYDPLPMMKLQTTRCVESSPHESTLGEDWFSDTIPSPANTEDLNPSTTSLSVDLHHYDLSPYNFGIHLPEFPITSHIENVEPGVPHHPINSATLSTVEPHSFTHFLQDAGLDYIDTFNMEFYLDSMPSYHPDLQCDQNKAANDFGVFVNSELLLSTPGYSDVPPSLVDGVYSITDNLDSTPAVPVKTPVLGNFNHAIPKALPNSEEQAAKRARAQALREELARYEAEGL